MMGHVMKRNLPLALFCAAFGFAAHSQTTTPGTQDWPGWHITAMDDMSTTRAYTNFVTNPKTGELVPDVHRITEIATGLNYFDSASGQWKLSQDLIELTPDGGAAAIRGPHRAYFKPDLASGFTLVTKSNRVFATRPLGIFYFDSISGQSVELAPLNVSATGELHPPNQIIWKSAFDSDAVQADLRVTYTRFGFECDVVYTRKPKPPEAWAPALNPETTQLQVRHVWFNCPAPINANQRHLKSNLYDEVFDFGDLWFPTGKAFAEDGNRSGDEKKAAQINLPRPEEEENSILVAKQWRKMGKSEIHLTESVMWKDVVTELSRLPEMAEVSGKTKKIEMSFKKDDLEDSSSTYNEKSSILLAKAPYREPGFVTDYITVGSGGDYDFTPGTYYISGNVSLNGSVTFNKQIGDIVLKYTSGSYLLISGTISVISGSGSKIILTSENEDIFGERFNWSTGNPSYSANIALWLYNLSGGTRLVDGFRIRWSQTAVSVSGNLVVTLANSMLQWCQTGVAVDTYNRLDILNTDKCHLLADRTPSGIVNGSFTDYCPGIDDWDTDGLSNSTECRYFGEPLSNQTSTSDFDGDCSPNKSEIDRGDNPCSPFPQWTGSNPIYRIIEVGTSTTLSAPIASPACVKYKWIKDGIELVGFTSNSYPINNAQPSHSGVYEIIAYTELGVTKSMSIRLSVLNSWGYRSWINYITTTNSKTDYLFSSRSLTPLKLSWNANSILHGKGGYTAISQLNTFTYGDQGVCPVTVLSPYHGYTRGHDMGYINTAIYTTAFNGTKVYFTSSTDINSTPVERTVRGAFVRILSDVDYTILMWDQPLPSEIEPIMVAERPTQDYFGVYFSTCKHNRLSANIPPFTGYELSKPAFNEHYAWDYGDSGSPEMLLSPSGSLVFVRGKSCTGPTDQMQADMDYLSDRTSPYVRCPLRWYTRAWSPNLN